MKKNKIDNRRFSKTISVNFCQRNQKQVDNLRLKSIQQMSQDCAKGDFK